MKTEYDIIILGGGPAGMTAALYAARSRMKVIVLEKLAPGGQMAITDFIENYPGFVPGVHGYELTQKMEDHARAFGAEVGYAEVYKIRQEDNRHVVETSEGEYIGKTIIIATGATAKRLGVPGEAEFIGRGVSYCATCDGAFYKDKKVVVVGGGDSAIDEAIYLTRFATKVTIVHRRCELRAIKVLQERAFENPKIDFQWNSVVDRIEGEPVVQQVVTHDVNTGEQTTIAADGVFVYIGLVPNTPFVPEGVQLEWGYIITAEDMSTGIPGIFAAGDVRVKTLRQVVTAAGDGATAAHSAEKYIEAHF
jgi:thioredoxin reductase (NADPH)